MTGQEGRKRRHRQRVIRRDHVTESDLRLQELSPGIIDLLELEAIRTHDNQGE